MLENDDEVLKCIQNKYISRQVLMTRPLEEWKVDVMTR